jgi:uncharacterized phage-associated protein
MRVNLRKLRQLIIFFAHHESVKPLGKTKLFKLLYFTDVTHIRTVGEPITGAEYRKFPRGPVPTQGNFVLKDLQLRRLIKQKSVLLPNARFMREFTALQVPDMAIFTEQERDTISRVIQEYGKDTASVLSWRSHQEYAWLFAKERMPLQLTSDKPNTESENKNAAAIAWVEQWYATPDDQPPGYWEEFEELLKTHPIDFGDKDLEL